MYDPGENQWTSIRALIGPRRGMGLGVVGDTLYMAGGHDGKSLQRSILKFNKQTQDWTVVGNLITSRGRFGC